MLAINKENAGIGKNKIKVKPYATNPQSGSSQVTNSD